MSTNKTRVQGFTNRSTRRTTKKPAKKSATVTEVQEHFINFAAEAMLELTEYDSRAWTRDEEAWTLLGKDGGKQKGLTGPMQSEGISVARQLFRTDPNARAAVMGVLKYVMGRGVNITPKSQDPRVWFVWREFWTSDRNKMAIRQFDIVKRFFRDGEVMLRYYQTREGTATWKTTVRFVEPASVQTPADKTGDATVVDGIEFDANDAEKPVAYHIVDATDPNKSERVEAQYIQHVKLFADMDQARGESYLQTISHMFFIYREWLKNRMILNRLRTAIVLIREVESGTATGVQNLTNQLPTSTRAGASGSKQIKSGTIYTAPPGVKMKMESANINASDVSEDGRRVILQMCAGTGQPEFMFGDASNQNYASALMSESPWVKEVEFWQTYLEAALFGDMFRRVIQGAVNAKKITPPAEEDIFEKYRDFDPADVTLTESQRRRKKLKEAGEIVDDGEPDAGLGTDNEDKLPERIEPFRETATEIFYGCDAQWPNIVHRDPKASAEALAIERANGWVSDKTASEKSGYDYGEEVRKQRAMEAEAGAEGNPLLGIKKGGAAEAAEGDRQAEEEAAALLAGMDEETKQAVMNAKNAEEVVAILSGKNGAAA